MTPDVNVVISHSENTPMFRATPQIAVTTIPVMICQRFGFVIVVVC